MFRRPRWNEMALCYLPSPPPPPMTLVSPGTRKLTRNLALHTVRMCLQFELHSRDGPSHLRGGGWGQLPKSRARNIVRKKIMQKCDYCKRIRALANK